MVFNIYSLFINKFNIFLALSETCDIKPFVYLIDLAACNEFFCWPIKNNRCFCRTFPAGQLKMTLVAKTFPAGH
jgi:hypothetical protein